MKRFTQILGISVLFFSLAACESMPAESSSGSPLWQRLQSASAAPGRHHKMRFQAGQGLHHPGAPDVGLPTEDQLATRGNGMRHRRHDGRRGGMNHPGRGSGRHGMRNGEGRGPRDGSGRRSDGLAPGEGRRPRGVGRHMGPPAEALSACENKAAGDACSFVIEGETVTSTCSTRRSGEGPLACRAGRGTHRRHDTPAQ
jgi:hypothetical protein